MMNKLKEEFISDLNLIENLGRWLFLCPFSGRPKYLMMGYNLTLFLVGFVTLQLTVTLFLVDFNDWLEIISIAPNIGACLVCIIKYTLMSKNNAFYTKIFEHFRNDLWELIPPYSEESLQIFVKYKAIARGLRIFMIYACIILSFVVDSFPWLIMTYERRILKNDYPFLYPFDAWYPFDKVKWYSVVYFWESFMTAVVIAIHSFGNIVHLNVIAWICMELTLIGHWLKELINKNEIGNIRRGKRLTKTHTDIKKKLKNLIKKHSFLYDISAGLDNVLGIVMLVSYIFDGAFICLAAFSALVIDNTYKSVRYSSFFLSLMIEMFTHCIIGQVLIDHSTALTEHIYYSEWTSADIETKKILLMLMRRTQKPFSLTANRFVVMELITFSGICKSSFSLFNLLRTMYEV